MTRFIHANNLALYTQDAAECSEPWLRWQYWFRDGWVDAAGPINFHPNVKYRRKPRTIRIGTFDVPEPVREPLEMGQEYWIACTTDGRAGKYWWNQGDIDLRWLADGLIHLTKEAAQIHIDALLSFTRRVE